MAFEVKTIKSMIVGILEQDYILPAIQRHFVWKPEQITNLFDSLMRGYPIGSFLFWRLKTDTIKQYKFYGFIKNYNADKNTSNPRVDPTGEKELTAILDGQQRLSAMLIGLKGSYTIKRPRMPRSNPQAYEKRILYLDLLNKTEDGGYCFAFLTENEAVCDHEHIWYRVGDILAEDTQTFLLGDDKIASLPKDKRIFMGNMLVQLNSCINKEKIISYYLEQDQDLDRVLNIFIRVNSGGTILTYSDLLFSSAVALWDKYDARNEIEEVCEYARDYHLNLTNDLVLKACLLVCNLDVKFKAANFNKTNMSKIEDNWENICKALKTSISLVSGFGYNSENIIAYNALLPIVYITYKYKLYETINTFKPEKTIKLHNSLSSLMTRIFLNKIFRAHTDSVLLQFRNAINKLKSKTFNLVELIKNYPALAITREDLEDIVNNAVYGKEAFTLLVELNNYPQNIPLDMDHMFPRAAFSNKNLKKAGIVKEAEIKALSEEINSIGNLNLLPHEENLRKLAMPFDSWVESLTPVMREQYLIPKMKEYSLHKFNDFCKKRRKLIVDKLAEKMVSTDLPEKESK